MEEIDNLIQMKKDCLERCPWHKQTNIDKLFKFVQEEMQELTEALEKDDHKNIQEELGDMF